MLVLLRENVGINQYDQPHLPYDACIRISPLCTSRL